MDATSIALIISVLTQGASLLLVVGLRILDTYLRGQGYTADQLAPLEGEITALSPGVPLATVTSTKPVLAVTIPVISDAPIVASKV